MKTTFIPAEDAIERKAQRELMKFAAGRAIFCSGGTCGGVVLDFRTVHVIALTGSDGRSAGSLIMCGDCGAKIVDVADDLIGRGTLHVVEVDTLKGTTVYAPEGVSA